MSKADRIRVAGMTTVDRRSWQPGPWDEEPDREGGFTSSGLAYFLIRHRYGFWLGYVIVPRDYPEDVAEQVYSCDLVYDHQMLGKTWAFDCNHHGDLAPGHQFDRADYARYATIEDARQQCFRIADEALRAWYKSETGVEQDE